MALLIATKVRTQTAYERVIMYTDNQAAIGSTRNPDNQSGQYLLLEIARELEALHNKGTEIEVRWVPAHRGIKGNETADVMAKEATGWKMVHQNNRRSEIDTGNTAPTPLGIYHLTAAIKVLIHRHIMRGWGKMWQDGDTGHTLFRLSDTPSKKTLVVHRNLPRPLSSVLTQMRTGNIGLRNFLYNRGIQKIESDICPCGQASQTVEHVPLNCRRHSALRDEMWTEENGRRRRITDLCSILNTPALAIKATRFIVQTRLLGQFGAVSLDK